ncbi:unnamed protein product [[Candida] boidinii]|nr:unnamed protein product [[Candida] boidinii]
MSFKLFSKPLSSFTSTLSAASEKGEVKIGSNVSNGSNGSNTLSIPSPSKKKRLSKRKSSSSKMSAPPTPNLLTSTGIIGEMKRSHILESQVKDISSKAYIALDKVAELEVENDMLRQQSSEQKTMIMNLMKQINDLENDKSMLNRDLEIAKNAAIVENQLSIKDSSHDSTFSTTDSSMIKHNTTGNSTDETIEIADTHNDISKDVKYRELTQEINSLNEIRKNNQHKQEEFEKIKKIEVSKLNQELIISNKLINDLKNDNNELNLKLNKYEYENLKLKDENLDSIKTSFSRIIEIQTFLNNSKNLNNFCENSNNSYYNNIANNNISGDSNRLSNPNTLSSCESPLSSSNSNFSNNSIHNNNNISNNSNSSSTTQLSYNNNTNEISDFQLQQYPYKHLNGNLRILSNENYTDKGSTYILPIIKTEFA